MAPGCQFNAPSAGRGLPSAGQNAPGSVGAAAGAIAGPGAEPYPRGIGLQVTRRDRRAGRAGQRVQRRCPDGHTKMRRGGSFSLPYGRRSLAGRAAATLLRAGDDRAYVAGDLGLVPQHRPWITGRRFGQGAARWSRAVRRCRRRALSTGSVPGRPDQRPPGCSPRSRLHGRGEPGRPAHLDGELVELRAPHFFGEQQRLGGQIRDRHAL
jgi:hypothetical protein